LISKFKPAWTLW